jgi:PAS domain S-box-containing protein
LDIAGIIGSYRERIIDEWVHRLHSEVSPRYAARPMKELGGTVTEGTDAYFEALTINSVSRLDCFIERIAKMRSESGFPLSDVQKALELYRSVLVPILERDPGYSPAVIEILKRLNSCVSHAIYRLSDYFQALHEKEITRYAQSLEAETSLRKERATFFSILEKAPYGMFVHSHDGKLIFMNPEAAGITGYTAEDISEGRMWLKKAYPDPAYEKRVIETWKNDVSLNGIDRTFSTHCKDGTVKELEFRAFRLPDGKTVTMFSDITVRKRAEEELNTAHQRLFDIIEFLPDATVVIDKDKKVIAWNRAIEVMTGVKKADVLGRSGYAYAVPFYGEPRPMLIDLLFDPDRNIEEKYVFLRSDGEKVYAEALVPMAYRGKSVYLWGTASPLFDTNGNFIGAIESVRDVTDRKQAEESLRISEEKYRSIFENAVEGIFQSAPEGHFLSVNPSLARMFGYASPEEMMITITDIGQQIYIDPEDRAMFKRLLEKAGFVERFEARCRRRDGRIIWTSLNARAVSDHTGRIDYLEGTIEDITARRHTEEALVESEAKYRNVVEESLVGFYIIQDTLFRYVNKRFCEIFGYGYEEIVNRLGPMDLVHPEDIPRTNENVAKRIRGEAESMEYEFRGIAKDGEVITLKVLGTAMSYEGRPAATGTIMDITREKTLESQLFQAQKMEAIGQLAGGVAHDFNNILSAVIGYADLLKMKIGRDDPHMSHVEQILLSSKKAANLTQSLLAFSRKQVIHPKPVEVNETIRTIKKLLARLLTEDIELATDLAEQGLVVMADESQLDQVIINLATNARDAMRGPGTISIASRKFTMDLSFIERHGFGQLRDYACISLTDTGMGMDEKTKGKIFEPFFTTKDPGKGTGLGLSIVYGIVKQHNGFIDVLSEENRGTTVNVYLPLTMEKAERGEEVLSSAPGGTETILIAEDNVELRNFMKLILSEQGYHTVEAIDGAGAIDQFARHSGSIDLVILDVVLPKNNGREVYDAITKIKPEARVLFTSGYTRDIIHDRGIFEEGLSFLPKPFQPRELLQRVRAELDGA